MLNNTGRHNATSEEGKRRQAGFSYPSRQVRAGPAPLASFEDLPSEELISEDSGAASPTDDWLIEEQLKQLALNAGSESLFDHPHHTITYNVNDPAQLDHFRVLEFRKQQKQQQQQLQLQQQSRSQPQQPLSNCSYDCTLSNLSDHKHQYNNNNNNNSNHNSVSTNNWTESGGRRVRPNQLRYAQPPSLSGSIVSISPVNSITPTRDLISPALTLTPNDPVDVSTLQHCSAQSLLSRPVSPMAINTNGVSVNQHQSYYDQRPGSGSGLVVHHASRPATRPSSAQGFLAPPSPTGNAHARSHSLDVGDGSIVGDNRLSSATVRRKSSWTDILFHRRSKSATDRPDPRADTQYMEKNNGQHTHVRSSSKRRSLFSFFRHSRRKSASVEPEHRRKQDTNHPNACGLRKNKSNSSQTMVRSTMNIDFGSDHIPAWNEFDSEASFNARHLQLLKELAAIHSPEPLPIISNSTSASSGLMPAALTMIITSNDAHNDNDMHGMYATTVSQTPAETAATVPSVSGGVAVATCQPTVICLVETHNPPVTSDYPMADHLPPISIEPPSESVALSQMKQTKQTKQPKQPQAHTQTSQTSQTSQGSPPLALSSSPVQQISSKSMVKPASIITLVDTNEEISPETMDGNACAESAEPQDLRSKIKQDIFHEEKILDDVGDDNTLADATDDQCSSIACFEADLNECMNYNEPTTAQPDMHRNMIKVTPKRTDTLDDVQSLPEVLPSNRTAKRFGSIDVNSHGNDTLCSSFESEDCTLTQTQSKEGRRQRYLRHLKPEEHEVSSLLQEDDEDEDCNDSTAYDHEHEAQRTDWVSSSDSSDNKSIQWSVDEQRAHMPVDMHTERNVDSNVDANVSECTQSTVLSDEQWLSLQPNDSSTSGSRRSSRILVAGRELTLQALERPRSSTPVSVAPLDNLIKATSTEPDSTLAGGVAKLSIHLPGGQFDQRNRNSQRQTNAEPWMQFCERSLQISPRHPVNSGTSGGQTSHFNWPGSEQTTTDHADQKACSNQLFADNFIDHAFDENNNIAANEDRMLSQTPIAASATIGATAATSGKSKHQRIESVSSDISSASSRLIESSPSDDTQSCALSLSTMSGTGSACTAVAAQSINSINSGNSGNSSHNSVSDSHPSDVPELHS